MLKPDELTLEEMASLIRRRVLTSVSLVDFYLQRIEERNPQINAIILQEQRESLYQQAEAADGQARKGQFSGPLHGIPITIKDVCHVKGFRMSRGVEPDSYTQVASCCLLYTSDAADDSLRVDLGGRRIIKKKKKK